MNPKLLTPGHRVIIRNLKAHCSCMFYVATFTGREKKDGRFFYGFQTTSENGLPYTMIFILSDEEVKDCVDICYKFKKS